ncbi:MAG: GGDEF domain-containing protein [Gammaproteobacteria bacterium]|nr:GGDEF domain-containing protein [Gammaproteobacteria bacterium]
MKKTSSSGPNINSESCEVLLELVDHLDAMVAYWDINQVCVFANDAYRHWFGKARREVIGRTLEELLGPIYPKNLPYIQAAYAGQVQVFERDIPAPDGRIRHSLATYTPHIVDGQVRGIFVHVADVSPLKRLERALRTAKAEAERLATHDALTGLPNRVLLFDRITQAQELSKRTRQKVAVLSVDIDDFKRINDSFGHPAGDKLLIEIAARLKHSLRECDSVTRTGGDEFILLVPAIESTAQIKTMATRILENVKAPVQLAGATVSPTCSVGIAIDPLEDATPDTLIACSDRALYLAKRLGKNQFAIAQFEGKP